MSKKSKGLRNHYTGANPLGRHTIPDPEVVIALARTGELIQKTAARLVAGDMAGARVLWSELETAVALAVQMVPGANLFPIIANESSPAFGVVSGLIAERLSLGHPLTGRRDDGSRAVIASGPDTPMRFIADEVHSVESGSARSQAEIYARVPTAAAWLAGAYIARAGKFGTAIWADLCESSAEADQHQRLVDSGL